MSGEVVSGWKVTKREHQLEGDVTEIIYNRNRKSFISAKLRMIAWETASQSSEGTALEKHVFHQSFISGQKKEHQIDRKYIHSRLAKKNPHKTLPDQHVQYSESWGRESYHQMSTSNK